MSKMSRKSGKASFYDPLMPNKDEDDGWSSFRTHSSFYNSDSSDREWLDMYKKKELTKDLKKPGAIEKKDTKQKYGFADAIECKFADKAKDVKLDMRKVKSGDKCCIRVNSDDDYLTPI
jgi:hypothetical protein